MLHMANGERGQGRGRTAEDKVDEEGGGGEKRGGQIFCNHVGFVSFCH